MAQKKPVCKQCGKDITPENKILKCNECGLSFCQECESQIQKEESFSDGFETHKLITDYTLCQKCYVIFINKQKELFTMHRRFLQLRETLPPEPDVWVSTAEQFMESGIYDLARLCFNEAINIDDENISKIVNSWENKGIKLLHESRYQDAILCFDEALSLDVKSENAWLNKGRAFDYLNKLTDALVAFDKVLQINLDNYEALSCKGLLLGKMKNIPGAEKCFNRAIQINSDDEIVWICKSQYHKILEEYTKLIDCVDQALQINPLNTSSWLSKWEGLMILKDFPEALKCCDEIIKLEPKNSIGWKCKGDTLVELEDLNQAVETYNKALNLDPEGVEIDIDSTIKNKRAVMERLGRLERFPEWMVEGSYIIYDYVVKGNKTTDAMVEINFETPSDESVVLLEKTPKGETKKINLTLSGGKVEEEELIQKYWIGSPITEGDQIKDLDDKIFTVNAQEEIDTPFGIINCWKLEHKEVKGKPEVTIDSWFDTTTRLLMKRIFDRQRKNKKSMHLELKITDSNISPLKSKIPSKEKIEEKVGKLPLGLLDQDQPVMTLETEEILAVPKQKIEPVKEPIKESVEEPIKEPVKTEAAERTLEELKVAKAERETFELEKQRFEELKTRFDEEVKYLEEERTSFEKTRTAFLNEKKNFIEQLAEFESDKSEFEIDKKSLQEEKEQIEDVQKQRQEKIEKSKIKRKEKHREEVMVKKELETERQKIERNRERLNEWKSRLKEEKRQLEEEKNQISEEKKQNMDLKEQLDQAQARLEEDKQKFESANVDLETVRGSLEIEKQEFLESKENLKKEINEFEQKKIEFDQELKKFESSKQQFDDEKNSFETDKQVFETNKQAFEEEKAHFDQEKVDWKKKRIAPGSELEPEPEAKTEAPGEFEKEEIRELQPSEIKELETLPEAIEEAVEVEDIKPELDEEEGKAEVESEGSEKKKRKKKKLKKGESPDGEGVDTTPAKIMLVSQILSDEENIKLFDQIKDMEELSEKEKNELIKTIDNYFDSYRRLLKVLNKSDVDISKIRKLIGKSRSKLKGKDYTGIIEIFSKLNIEIKTYEKILIGDEIEVLTKQIEDGSNEFPTASAIGALSKARKELEKENIENANSLISESQKLLSDMEEHYLRSKEIVENVEQKIQSFKNSGLNISKPMEILEEMQTAFKSHKYLDLPKLKRKCLLEIEKSRTKYSEVLEKIGTTQKKLAEKHKQGLNIYPSVNAIKEAKKFLIAGNYDQAIELTNKSLDLVEVDEHRVAEESPDAPSKEEDLAKEAKETPSTVFDISWGENYVLMDTTPVVPFTLQRLLSEQNVSSLTVSVLSAQELYDRYTFKPDIAIWLSESDDENTVDPSNLSKLTKDITKFIKGTEMCIVLIDGLELLIKNNDLDQVKKFLKDLNKTINKNQAILILIMNPNEASEADIEAIKEFGKDLVNLDMKSIFKLL